MFFIHIRHRVYGQTKTLIHSTKFLPVSPTVETRGSNGEKAGDSENNVAVRLFNVKLVRDVRTEASPS